MRSPAIVTVLAVLATLCVAPAQAQVFNGEYTVDEATNTGPQVFGDVWVGQAADGTVHVLDGRLVRWTGTGRIGMTTQLLVSPTGTVNVLGNDSRLQVDLDLFVGVGTNTIRTARGFLHAGAGGRVRARALRLSAHGAPSEATVTVSGSGSLLEIGTVLELNQVGTSRLSTVRIQDSGTLSVGTTIDVPQGSPRIHLEGGTLSLVDPSALPPPGVLEYASGTFRFRTGQTLDGGPGFYTDTFGSPPVLAAGRGLAVDGTTTLATTLLLDGGSLHTERVAVDPATGSLLLHGGTLTLTGERAVLDDDSDFGLDPVTVGDGAGAPALLDLAGAGEVMLGPVTVASDGALTFGGETLSVASLLNAGRITVTDATLDLGSGLLHAGSLSLADAVVEGSVQGLAGSSIDVAGTVVFQGDVTGAAGFFGSGTAVFHGNVSVD